MVRLCVISPDFSFLGSEEIRKCISYLNSPRFFGPVPFSFLCNNNEVLSITSVTAMRRVVDENLVSTSLWCFTWFIHFVDSEKI